MINFIIGFCTGYIIFYIGSFMLSNIAKMCESISINIPEYGDLMNRYRTARICKEIIKHIFIHLYNSFSGSCFMI